MPNFLRLRTLFLIAWLGGVILPFWLGLWWLYRHLPVDSQGAFYLAVLAFAYTFWFLFLMMLIYNHPLREVRRLAQQAEILVMEHAKELPNEPDKEPAHSLEALATHLEKLGAAFRKRAIELEKLVAEATSRLQIEKEVLALILKSVAEGILVVSREFRIVLVNPTASLMFGEEKAFLGGSALSIFDQETLVSFFEKLEKVPAGSCLPIKWQGYEGSVCLLRQENGKTLGLVMSFRCPEGQPCSGRIVTVPAEDLSSLTAVETPPFWRPVAYDFDLFEAEFPRLKPLNCPLRELTYTVFDTETTGLEPSLGDKIVAIGAVRIERVKLLKDAMFHTLVNPERPIPRTATKIHGITDEMVKGKPPLREVLPRFLEFCRDTVLVAHNAAFDLKFLEIEAQKLGLKLNLPVVDTLFISYGLFQDFDVHNLDSIAKRLGIPVVGLHSALGDALLTAEIFLKMLPYLEKRGITTLEELFAFCRRMYALRRLQKSF